MEEKVATINRNGWQLSPEYAVYLKEHEIALRSMTEPFDTATPTGEFVLTLLGSIATLELNTIKERTALGQKRIAEAGKWTGGVIPYGYRTDDGGF